MGKNIGIQWFFLRLLMWPAEALDAANSRKRLAETFTGSKILSLVRSAQAGGIKPAFLSVLMELKIVSQWEEIALHGSQYLAFFGGRWYSLHERIKYDVRKPSTRTVIIGELKATLKENQQAVIDNINEDFAQDTSYHATINLEVGERASRYFLTSKTKPDEKFEIKSKSVFIGRAETCDIVILHPRVSRRHCLLQLGEEGLTFKDLESNNGVFCNGVRLRSGSLKHGDVLRLGRYELIVHRVIDLQDLVPGTGFIEMPMP
jgi:hypothetical protein